MQKPEAITVTVLAYGDYPALTQRCLRSLRTALGAGFITSIRVGLNEVCDATRQVVHHVLQQCPAETEALIYDSKVNRLKYPLLRKMLLDREHPVITPLVMHFDDDSYLESTVTSQSWWNAVSRELRTATVIGGLYTKQLAGKQAECIEAQSWFNGKIIKPNHRVRFATGGWWAAQMAFLELHNYPFPYLHHNGGDVVLGELCRQQNGRLRMFKPLVCINADDKGKESAAVRRGVSQPPLWVNGFQAPPEPFEIHAYDPRKI